MAKSRARKLADLIVGAGIDIDGNLTFDGGSTSADLTFADNDKANFGDASDLQIYHDGSSNLIQGSNGSLYIQAKAGENSILATPDGGVNLYHDNSLKFETTSTGATVTGVIRATGGELYLGTADTASAHINSYEVMTFNIDSDNDDTNRYFGWFKNGNSGSGTSLMRLTEDGYLGIATGAPQAKLEVNLFNQGTLSNSAMNASNVNDVEILRAPYGSSPETTSNAGAKWGLRLVGRNDGTYDNGKSAAVYAVSEDALGYNREVGLAFHTSAFDASHAERMRIDADGNVGIGVTSPGLALDVYGEGRFSRKSSTSFLLNIESTGGEGRVLRFKDDGGTKNNWIVGTQYNIDNGFEITPSTAVGGATFSSPAFVIRDTGKIGIGTSSPTKLLTLGYPGADTAFEILNSGNSRMVSIGAYSANEGVVRLFNSSNVETVRIAAESTSGVHTYFNGGRVGIGTTSPQQKLAVVEDANYNPPGLGNSGGNFGIFKTDGNTSGDYGIMWGVQSSGDVWQQVQRRDGTATAYDLLLQPSGGDVTIGTTSPRNSAKFTVAEGKINAGTDTSVGGSVTLENYYGNGVLSAWGSTRSSGGAAMLYGVYPSTTSQTVFTSSTGVALNRGAYVVDDVHRFYTGANQTVAVGSNVTMSEVMRIETSGNLLFGQTSAIAQNTIDGGDNRSLYLCGGGTQSVGRGGNIRLHGNEATLGGYTQIYSGNEAGADLELYAYGASSELIMYTGGANPRLTIASDGRATFANRVDFAGVLIGTTAGNYVQVTGSGGTAWTMSSSGGNNTPSAAASTTFGLHHWNGSAWGEKFTVTNSGNVGIGTSAPSAPLHIDAAGMGDIYSGLVQNTTTDTDHYNVIRWMQGASGSATGMIGTGGSSTGNPAFRNTFVVGTQNSTDLVLASADTERMRIKSSGYVGIGTTNPAYLLAVNGSTESFALTLSDSVRMTMGADGTWNYIKGKSGQGFRFSTTGATASDVLVLQNDGQVGISTNNSYNSGALVVRSQNAGINVDPGHGILIVNRTAYSGGQNRFIDAYTTSTGASTTLYHYIRTNINASQNVMYKAHVTGYNYGTSKILDLYTVGYAYAAGSALTAMDSSVLHSSGATIESYLDVNNNVVLKIYVGTSSYYCGFRLDMEFTNPTGYSHDFKITEAAWSTSSTNLYT